MAVLEFLNLPDSADPDTYHAALKDAIAQLEAHYGSHSSVFGTATGGSATTLVDTALAAGVDAFAGALVLIWRNGSLLRAEKVVSNTATTLTFAAGTAVAAGDTYDIYAVSNGILASEKGAANGVPTLDAALKVVQRLAYEGVANGVPTLDNAGNVVERLSYEGAPSGVATLDANGEVVQLPAGAAAAAATDPTAVLRADGTWQTIAGGLQPCYAACHGPALTPLTHNTLTKISGFTAYGDPYGAVDATEGFIIPAEMNGRILVFSASVPIEVGAEYAYAELQLGGTAIAKAASAPASVGTQQIVLNLSSYPIQVSTGDIINLYVKQYDASVGSLGVQWPTLGLYQVGANS